MEGGILWNPVAARLWQRGHTGSGSIVLYGPIYINTVVGVRAVTQLLMLPAE